MTSWRAGAKRDFVVQAFGNYISSAARIVRGLALAALLSPTQMGAVSISNLLMSLSQYSDLGISMAVMREISVGEGRGDDRAYASWVWYGVLARLAGGSLFLTGCLAYALASDVELSNDVRWAVVSAGVAGLALGAATALQYALQARRSFVVSVRIILMYAIANMALSIGGVYVFGLPGVFAAQVCAAVIAVIVAVAYGLGEVAWPPRVRRASVIRLVRVGFPILLMSFMGFGLENVDQVVILRLLDREQLGLYSLVLAAGSALYLLPLSVSNVVGPRLMQAYGAEPNTDAIFRHTWEPVRVLGSILPPAILLAWTVLPALIAAMLPDYLTAIPPMRIYLVGMFFLGLNLGISTTLLAMRKHRYTAVVMAASIAFNVVADAVLVGVLGLGIVGVALGSLATYATFWFAHSWIVRRQFVQSHRVAVVGNLLAAVPGFLLVTYLVAVNLSSGLQAVATGRDALACAMSVGLCAVWWRSGRGHGWVLGEGADGHA